ncbi:hypothetical protein JCM10049v2_003753 [Rhodotorula toruloides]
MPPSTRSSSAPKAPQKADPAPAKPAGGAKGRKGGAKEDEGKDATKPKKRKTGGKQGKGKAEEVLEMGRDVFSTLPMDLVLQICSDVDPGTLLAIGQMSKSICSTLFRKAAEPVWLAARRNVGMPDLQAEMDEPTYAYLVQGKACQVCGTTRLKTEAEHELRVCACSKCMTANLRNASRIRNEMEDLHPLALECCLSTPYSAAGNTRADEEHSFWVPEVAAVSDHLDAIDSPPKPENDDEQEPEYSPNDDAQLFREECRQRKVKVSADAATIFKYESRSLDENLAEEKRKIEARMAQIRDRLIAAGFVAQDVLAIPRGYDYGGVRLSDDEWAKIQPTVTALATHNRQRRLSLERAQRQQDRRNALQPLFVQVKAACSASEQAIFPRKKAFDQLPTVKRLWSTTQTLHVTILSDVRRLLRLDKVWMFDQLARVLHEANIPLPPRVVKVITSERSVFVDEKDESKGLAPLHEQLPDAVIDQLFSRPVALFVCSNSTCLNKSYPDILAHVASSHPWSEPDNVSCVPAGAEYLKLIDTMLDEANLDRLNTTSQDLKRLGGRFAVTLRDGSVKRNVSWTGVAEGREPDWGITWFGRPAHMGPSDLYLVDRAIHISLQPPPPPPRQLGNQTLSEGTSGGRAS